MVLRSNISIGQPQSAKPNPNNGTDHWTPQDAARIFKSWRRSRSKVKKKKFMVLNRRIGEKTVKKKARKST